MLLSVKKLLKLNIKELWLLTYAWLVFLKWDLLISFIDFKKWRAQISHLALENNNNTLTTNTANLTEIKLIINISEIAGRRHIKKMNCLRRCLTQKQLLNRRGYQCNLHLGVTIEQGNLKAHSWLSFQGLVINDSEDVSTRYSELKVASEQDIFCALK